MALKRKTHSTEPDGEQNLREMNSALLVGSVHQHELAAAAERARITADGLAASLLSAHSQLEAALADSQMLQRLGIEMASHQDVQRLYDILMDGAVEVMRSDFASIQSFFPDRGEHGELLLLSERGFNPEGIEHWKWVRIDSGSACGEAFRTGARCLVRDVEQCDFIKGDDLAGHLNMEMRGVQTTPLFSRTGALIGMISTHWKTPTEPCEREWRMLDALAGHAAALIERIHTEEALRRTAETFGALVERSPLGIYTVDADFRIRHVSVGSMPAFRNVSPLIGRDFGEVMHIIWPDRFATEAIAIFRRVLETGEPYISPGLTEERKDLGSTESYEWQVNPVALDDGRLGAVCYFFDSTRLKESNQALRESEAALRDLNESLEEKVSERTSELLRSSERLHGFTYSVAHDIRQQIRGINANASIVLGDYQDFLDDTGKLCLSKMVSSARKLGTLVDELLTYARLDQQTPRVSRVDLTHLAEEVASQLIEGPYGDRQPKFEIAENLEAQGDPTMVTIVLQNLLDNACKYSQGSESSVIEVGVSNGDFFVRDNGIGFDMRYAHKLFQPFERLHRESEYSGTGIGLANVKRIVEMHGGRVWAEGTPGKGATFYFTLA